HSDHEARRPTRRSLTGDGRVDIIPAPRFEVLFPAEESMGYKFKPNKGVAKRMKVTATGKLKHRHEKNSHLRSGRSSALKRRLGRPSVLDEGQASRLRTLLGATAK